MTGVEPAITVWKTVVLPLHHTHVVIENRSMNEFLGSHSYPRLGFQSNPGSTTFVGFEPTSLYLPKGQGSTHSLKYHSYVTSISWIVREQVKKRVFSPKEVTLLSTSYKVGILGLEPRVFRSQSERITKFSHIPLGSCVRVTGLEPAIFWSQTRRITKLSHTRSVCLNLNRLKRGCQVLVSPALRERYASPKTGELPDLYGRGQQVLLYQVSESLSTRLLEQGYRESNPG